MVRALTLLAVVLLCAASRALGQGQGGHGGGHGDREKHMNDHAGIPGHMHGEAHQRFGGNPAAYQHMGHYGGSAAPISTPHDLHYIQNHLAAGFGLPVANDNGLQIPAPPQSSFRFAADPGGGVVAASPGVTKAPWEVGVNRALVNIDLGMNSKDAYANRVAGIQDSFKGDYASALPLLKTAMEGGQKDATTLSFAALAAFHRGEMKDATAWAKESLDKDAKGPWSSLADSVEHLTEDRVGKMRLSKPKTDPNRSGTDPVPGAVGAKLFPKGVDVSEPLKGAGGVLAEARAALAIRDLPQVEKLSSTVLFTDPTNAEALRLRAAAEVRGGRYAEALGDAAQGLTAHPESADYYEALALASGRSGDYKTAREAALKLTAANPRSASALRLLAFAEAGLSDRAAALAALERAAALDAATAALLQHARSLPADGDMLALFTDSFLLGDEPAPAAAAAGGDSAGWSLAKTVLSLGGGILGGLALALTGMALLKRRRGKPVEGGPLDLSEFRPRTRSRDPETVGPFKVLERVGSGGMGVVYRAEDTRLGRVVALKRLREEVSGDPRERARFLKEARIVSALDHPGIVRIYAVEEAADGYWLVFEYIEGKTLSEILSARKALPPAEARDLLVQTADAVAYAHDHGVVHRDLKPSNIMVDAEGRVHVMDFGVASAEREALQRLTGDAASGSPPYIAPEQAEGATSPAGDVFALGVCLYELLAGRPPFEGTAGAMHLAKREGRYRALGSPVDAVIARALEPKASLRFASPRDLAAALLSVSVTR